MSNGDENNNNQGPPTRGITEEELARERLKVLEKTTDSIRKQALEEGKLLEALRATINLRKEELRIQLEYDEAIDSSREAILETVEVLEARERIIQKTISSANKLKGALKIPDTGMGNFVEDLAKASQELGDDDDGLRGQIKSLYQELDKTRLLSVSAGKALANLGALGFTQIARLATQLDQANASFTAQTGIIGSLRESIGETARANFNLGIGFNEVGAATRSLASEFSQFIVLGEEQQRVLVDNATQLEKIGLSTATFASTVNELNRSFGMTPTMTNRTIRSLAALGIELGIGVDQINRNFVESLPRLRVYGDRAVEVFRELQIQAREAGTSVSSLNSIFGEQLDTFQGAATAAGRLNAVLGADLFSTTELLLATESERVDIMRERIAMAGVEFTNLGKFQQRALAAAAGINDVNEAAKIFGATQGEITTQIGSLTLTQAELEERIQRGRTVFNKLEFAIMSLAVTFEPIVDLLGMFGDGLTKIADMAGEAGPFGRFIASSTLLIGGYQLTLFGLARAFQAVTASASGAAVGVGRFSTVARGGALGLAGGALGAGAGAALGQEGRVAKALTGAGMGAGIGMMFGPYGALAGAALGAGAGALIPMADGGIVTGPTPALVGEAGTEAIVPLDAFTNKLDELIDAVRSPTGGGDIVVKVMLNDRELGGAVADIVDRRFAGQLLKR